jgi:hypothetical protein
MRLGTLAREVTSNQNRIPACRRIPNRIPPPSEPPVVEDLGFRALGFGVYNSQNRIPPPLEYPIVQDLGLRTPLECPLCQSLLLKIVERAWDFWCLGSTEGRVQGREFCHGRQKSLDHGQVMISLMGSRACPTQERETDRFRSAKTAFFR